MGSSVFLAQQLTGMLCTLYDYFPTAMYCSLTVPLVYQLGVKVSSCLSPYWKSYQEMEATNQKLHHHRWAIGTVIYFGIAVSLSPTCQSAALALPLLIKQTVRPFFLKGLDYTIRYVPLESFSDHASFKIINVCYKLSLLSLSCYSGQRLIRYFKEVNGRYSELD